MMPVTDGVSGWLCATLADIFCAFLRGNEGDAGSNAEQYALWLYRIPSRLRVYEPTNILRNLRNTLPGRM